ncbi:RDD [Burkholderiaceae bacterium]
MKNSNLAGLWSRIGGGLIDLMILTLITVATALPLGIWLDLGTSDKLPAQHANVMWKALFVMVAIVIDFGYTIILQAGTKQSTWGQRAVGVKLTTVSGETVSIGRAVARYIVSIPSSLLFKLGYAVAVFTKNKQTLHDLAAGTIVVMQDPQPISVPTNNEKDNVKANYAKVANQQQATTNPAFAQTSSSTSVKEEEFWEQAANELESPQRKVGLWAKCFAETNGDENKTKVEYLKQRVAQLVIAESENISKQQATANAYAAVKKSGRRQIAAKDDSSKSASGPALQGGYIGKLLIAITALTFLVVLLSFISAGINR